MSIYYEPSYLAHHGVKGMKWGVRRYQNKDGSLTPAGKKRASKEYKKYAVAAQQDQGRAYQRLYIDAHNKTADEYNRYKTSEFNKKHDPSDKDYEKRLNKQFEADFQRNLNKSMLEFTKNNKNYQKAVSIADKYGLYSYDELARENKRAIETMDAYVSGRISYEEAMRRSQQN